MKTTRQAGQSTIEFILTFSFGLGIVFLFVNIAVNYAAGYLVHYATFMASRTYLTVEANRTGEGTNNTLATSEALKTFARFRMSALGIDSGTVKASGSGDEGFHINPYNPPPSNIKEYIYVGAYTVFERPISIFKLVAGGEKAKYISESYLGKEPTRINCWEQTCRAIILGLTDNATACDALGNNDFTVFDNGC